MRTVYAQKNKKIILGRQGEDKAVRVVWPGIVSDWSSLYGDGSFQLSVRRFGDENAYPVVVEVNGDDISFTVTSAETEIAGIGKCELTYIANGTIAKSATWETVVLNSLTGQTPSEPPEEPAKSWFTSIQGQIGNLADLATTSKDNLVAAINEAAQSGGGGSGGASIELDTTLSEAGKAADAKAVGDALAGKQPKGDYLTQNELPDMTAYRTAEAQNVIDAGKQDTLIQSGASVGQIAKITAVDENGKPTAWEAVDMPSGGGSGKQLLYRHNISQDTVLTTDSFDTSGANIDLSVYSHLYIRGMFICNSPKETYGYFYLNGVEFVQIRFFNRKIGQTVGFEADIVCLKTQNKSSAGLLSFVWCSEFDLQKFDNIYVANRSQAPRVNDNLQSIGFSVVESDDIFAVKAGSYVEVWGD